MKSQMERRIKKQKRLGLNKKKCTTDNHSTFLLIVNIPLLILIEIVAFSYHCYKISY